MRKTIICEECGKLYSEEDLAVYDKSEPEYEYIQTEVGTIPHFVGWVGEDIHCPECGGDLVEATECECCGELKAICSNNWVCEDCKDEYLNREPLKVALGMGEYSYTKKSINGFIDFLFTEEKINEILIDYVKEHKDDLITELLAVKYARKIEHNRDLDFAILELKDEENKGNDNGNS